MCQYQLPKMSLQPILENAIYHGIKEKQARGTIVPSLGANAGRPSSLPSPTTAPAWTISRWTSSGPRSTRSPPRRPKSSSRSGLASVNRRIRLLYGEGYGISIDSRLGSYTRVTLTLPKKP